MNRYVDLGLPSGTLWAAMNVGAKSIIDCGKYFTLKEAMKCDVTLPTKKQFEELVGNTTYKWVKNYNNCGMNGKLFIGKNGNEVFFPASGHSLNGRVYFIGSASYYWSSALTHDKSYAYYLYYDANRVLRQLTNCGDFAFTLRGVKNK